MATTEELILEELKIIRKMMQGQMDPTELQAIKGKN